MLMFQDAGASDVEGGTGAQTKPVNTGDILTTPFSEGVYSNALKLEFDKVAEYFKGIGSKIIGPTGVYNTANYLDTEQAKLRAAVGLGSQKADEFKKLIADGAAKFAAVGLSTANVGKTYLELADVFKTDISISDQNLLELAATAKVTGQSTKDLAAGFRGVGISIQEVGENMTEVAKIARQAGVSIAAVSADVVKNLDKMNIYNFENGVKGLAKMAAQSNKLGIDMDKIFTVVDKAFNPESAIEMAAAMQRLGVSTGALLDPLRLMDLAQNDPTELQNQIVNMTKDFVRFNKELGQFEIMPGEKRRLNEIAKELGMTNGELQKMAINAAGLDMKMKQIRFPSSIASKEDRELIATLAQVNRQGVSEIKVAMVDKEGKKTGEYDMVEVSELTVEQLERIKEDQELRGKSMEEIAVDQLSELRKLSTSFDALAKGIGYGASSREDVSTPYNLLTKGTRETLFGDKIDDKEGKLSERLKSARTYREVSEEDLKKLTIGAKDDIVSLFTSIGSALDFKNFDLTSITTLSGNIKDAFGDAYDYVTEKATDFFGGTGTNVTSSPRTTTMTNQNVTPNAAVTNNNQTITNQNLNQNISRMSFDPLKIEQETKVTMDIKLPDGLNLDSNLTTAIQRWFEQQSSKEFILNELKKLNTNNSLT